MRTPLDEALAAGPVVLDGGLATQLEAAGADLSSALWSARLLRDDPGAIVAAHAAFADAGAQVATTASYQATVRGFAAAGIDAPAPRRCCASRSRSPARGRPTAWVAGSVGPYGAMLADGSEYTGALRRRVGVPELRAFHRPRMEVLADAGADVLACETVPAAAEAEALLAEADALGVPAWLSLPRSPGTTASSAPGAASGPPTCSRWRPASTRSSRSGVNCTDPAGVAPAVAVAARLGKPVVVYPNSGEGWDAAARRWTGSPGLSDDAVRGLAGRRRPAGRRLLPRRPGGHPAHLDDDQPG